MNSWIAMIIYLNVFFVVHPRLTYAREDLTGKVEMALPLRVNCSKSGNDFVTRYFLYTRQERRGRLLAAENNTLLENSKFVASDRTVFVVHGFFENLWIFQWMWDIKDRLLDLGYFNVILVDWSCGNDLPYSKAIHNSRITAQSMRDLIKYLMRKTGATSQSFHLVGHSLGVQVCAYTGKLIPNIGRITGLDQAGPSFYNTTTEDRLDASDALFVDVIHSNGAENMLQGLGYYPPSGHLDFYPNGGRRQPGCTEKPLKDVVNLDLPKAVYDAFACSHYQSVHMFIDSILPKENGCIMVGVECKSYEAFLEGMCSNCAVLGNCAVMGFHSNKNIHQRRLVGDRNKYFLKTSGLYPYCLFQMQVVIETNCHRCSRRGPGFQSGIVTIDVHVRISYPDSRRSEIRKVIFELDWNNAVLPYKDEYTYYAHTKYPLSYIENATARWSDPMKNIATKPTMSFYRVRILPIKMSSTKSQTRPITLCFPSKGEAILDQVIHLRVNGC